ncbi:Pathogenesis-related protein [Arachis hypogaea]|nr:Pathogenesis-related protein [Arachis hypogaea]
MDKDFYDVSMVDGYNLPLVALPRGVSGGACCPRELQVLGEDENQRGVVGCRSACEAFKSDRYCCTGQYANPKSCQPTFYSTIFKKACPRAYSYAFDDGTRTFTCKASEYEIVFCPYRFTTMHHLPQL